MRYPKPFKHTAILEWAAVAIIAVWLAYTVFDHLSR